MNEIKYPPKVLTQLNYWSIIKYHYHETLVCLCYIKVVNTHWDLTVALKEKALKKLRAFLLPFEYFMNGIHLTLNY